MRRADALGWFLTENGRRVRFFVDTDDWPQGRARRSPNALAASGLSLAPASSGGLEARPLWPDPRQRWRWLPSGSSAAWALLALVALRRARAVAAAAVAAPGAGGRGRGRARRRRSCSCPSRACAAPAGSRRWRPRLIALRSGRGASGARRATPASRRAAACGCSRWRSSCAGGWLRRRLRVGTRQWGAAPMFFVSVRGELDEPVVLREIRRLTD